MTLVECMEKKIPILDDAVYFLPESISTTDEYKKHLAIQNSIIVDSKVDDAQLVSNENSHQSFKSLPSTTNNSDTPSDNKDDEDSLVEIESFELIPIDFSDDNEEVYEEVDLDLINNNFEEIDINTEEQTTTDEGLSDNLELFTADTKEIQTMISNTTEDAPVKKSEYVDETSSILGNLSFLEKIRKVDDEDDDFTNLISKINIKDENEIQQMKVEIKFKDFDDKN